VLITLLLAVGWSAAVCDTSCFLPHDNHGCCATHADKGKPGAGRQQVCSHLTRTTEAPPVLSFAAVPPDAKALPIAAPSFDASPVTRVPAEAPSPPKFNLRI